jgi:transcriptional antiterminator NusG
MKMTDKSWYVVRNTPGVTGFVSPGLKPVPLPADEVEKIKQLMGLSAPVKVNIELEVGQVVRITSGALQDRTGTVVEVNPESEKVRILVNMFGRETPTTVELGQVEKI